MLYLPQNGRQGGQKNDFRDAEAIAEAVQRPTMKFVATKTAEQLDLQALHWVRERLVSQRTGIINQIRAFLLERGLAVRQGLRFLRAELPRILATPCDALSSRMLRVIEDLARDWRRLDERIDGLSSEIEVLARRDVAAPSCWSVALPCGRACASCALSCHAFSPRPAMPCRHACCASSRTWQGTGAGLMSASMVYRVRSRFLHAEMSAVNA
jgi:Transposase